MTVSLITTDISSSPSLVHYQRLTYYDYFFSLREAELTMCLFRPMAEKLSDLINLNVRLQKKVVLVV